MVRVECFVLKHNLSKLSAETQHKKLMECFKNVSRKVQNVKQERNINYTLLTMDIGKYGSIRMRENSRLDINLLNQAALDFFDMTFGDSLTKDQWEQSFEEVAQFKVPGYIAIMQQALAANSVCLLLAGGYSYQSNTKALYDELHPQSKCVLHAC